MRFSPPGDPSKIKTIRLKPYAPVRHKPHGCIWFRVSEVSTFFLLNKFGAV